MTKGTAIENNNGKSRSIQLLENTERHMFMYTQKLKHIKKH